MFQILNRLSKAFLIAAPLSGGAVQEVAANNNTCVLRQSTGMASYYNQASSSKTTALGKYFDDKAITAAHRWLKFGSIVRVTDMKTGKSIDVEINDNGPYTDKIIDLSEGSAMALMNGERDGEHKRRGVARVELEVLHCG